MSPQEAALAKRKHRSAALAWIDNIRPGDALRPKPLWNNTERTQARQLPVPTIVEAVISDGSFGHSQTGIMLLVRSKTGNTLHLDAGWFCRPGAVR